MLLVPFPLSQEKKKIGAGESKKWFVPDGKKNNMAFGVRTKRKKIIPMFFFKIPTNSK